MQIIRSKAKKMVVRISYQDTLLGLNGTGTYAKRDFKIWLFYHQQPQLQPSCKDFIF